MVDHRRATHPSTGPGHPRRIAIALLALWLAIGSGGALAEADAGLEAWREVFPDTTRLGPVEGDPPAAAAYRDETLAGWVFGTHAVVASSGYAGKPLDVLVGLDVEGRITGARIVEQHEPILVLGLGPEDLAAFAAQYRGQDIRLPIKVSRSARQAGEVDAVAGATISSTVINDAILRSARAVARSRGLFGDEAARIDHAFEPAGWDGLLADGSLARLQLTVEEAQAALAERDARIWPEGAEPSPDATFSELVFGLATPARIGRNLVGERLYDRVVAELAEGDQLIFVGGRGLYSYKGTAWRRSGVFERLQLVQGETTFQFTEPQHRRLDGVVAEGAPELRELALFTLPREGGFDPVAPWRLELLASGTAADGGEVLVSFGQDYQLPERYVRAPPAAFLGEDEPPWIQVWRDRIFDIALLAIALVTLTGVFIFQDAIVQRRRLYLWLRTGFLLFTLVWIGWYAAAQLSVVNVLTFAEALRTQFHWEFFLLEPLIFILWSYVAVALLFWGRGVFCGWLCPFGALQELSNKLARRLRVPQYRVPFALHERLWPLKYVAFLGLFALSLGPAALALELSEIEPFKTAIVLRFDRAWPFVLYALGLLAVGLFVERAFCRYLCPLGAAFAIPARLRQFEWLKRHRQCGAPCQICATDCPVQAIHPEGRINPNECIYCMACQVNYWDDHVCPPMIERRKRREKRDAMIAKARAGGEAP
jgi:NosR/NirI family transcriptional regulator, nitrous oxide reductase regulator